MVWEEGGPSKGSGSNNPRKRRRIRWEEYDDLDDWRTEIAGKSEDDYLKAKVDQNLEDPNNDMQFLEDSDYDPEEDEFKEGFREGEQIEQMEEEEEEEQIEEEEEEEEEEEQIEEVEEEEEEEEQIEEVEEEEEEEQIEEIEEEEEEEPMEEVEQEGEEDLEIDVGGGNPEIQGEAIQQLEERELSGPEVDSSSNSETERKLRTILHAWK